MDSTLPYAPLCSEVEKWTNVNHKKRTESREKNISAVCPLIHVHTLSYQKHAQTSLLLVPQDLNSGEQWLGQLRTAAVSSTILAGQVHLCAPASSGAFLRGASVQARGREPTSAWPRESEGTRTSLHGAASLEAALFPMPTLQPPLNSFLPRGNTCQKLLSKPWCCPCLVLLFSWSRQSGHIIMSPRSTCPFELVLKITPFQVKHIYLITLLPLLWKSFFLRLNRKKKKKKEHSDFWRWQLLVTEEKQQICTRKIFRIGFFYIHLRN